jgi:class 3 adenylate cyclase/TolB-like protein/Tfp pilus assembly protein PilF
MPQTRQLAAIMFTDIVGYTALMGEDEQRAFELLNKNRQLQRPLIEQHNGQWIKEIGDGVLASFPTVTDAVSAAIAIQEGCNRSKEFFLRIGIHQGEVVFENGDLFGDAVNIASRLQALAPVGGIWVSEAVYKNIANKKEIGTRFVREEVLKNVKEPVRIYEITTGEAAIPLTPSAFKHVPPPSEKNFHVTKKPPSLFFIAVVTVFLLAVISVAYWVYNNSTTKQINSIAVLPFINESRNADLEYLSDGMTEMLISSLSQLPGINVKARSSVFRYKGKEAAPYTVGKELNVQAVLNGMVVQRGEDLAVYVELVDAQKETVLWSEDYKQPMASLVSLQNEITRDVSQKLKMKLSGTEEQKLAKNYPANSEAYQLYLKGRYYWNKATSKDTDKSIEYFQQAIALDPNYALAYAGLADSYASPFGGTPSQEKIVKSRDAALKALALDDNLAEAHAAYGRVLSAFDYDFTAAEREFRRAIELNPNYAITYYRYAQLSLHQGRFEKAVTQIRRALEIEPLDVNNSAAYGFILIYARRYDEAIAQLKKTLELDANFHNTHNFLSFAYRLKGDYAQSVEERAKALELIGDTEKAARVRESFTKGGWTGFLRLVTREALTPVTGYSSLATYYAALGEKDEAFAALNKALENRESLANIKVDPHFDPLRSDPRFQELVQRIGFK